MRSRDLADDRSTRRLAGAALALVALIVAGAVFVATASGLGVSPDGVAYLSLADEFRTTGSPYAVLAPSPTHYAPLWSMIVGGLSAVTSVDDLLAIGRVLNTIVAASIVPLVYLAVRRSALVPAWWAVLATAVASLTFGLFRLSVRALTEPLFIALIVGTLVLVESGRRQRSRPLLIAAAVVAAGATMTRFAGVAVVVPLAVAAAGLASPWRRRIADAIVVSAIAVAPTAIWALLAPSTTASTHLDSGDRASFGDAVQSVVEAGYAFIDPPSESVPDPIYLVLGAVVLFAPFVAALAVARQERAADPRRDAPVERLDVTGLVPWLLFLAAYGALVVVQRWWIGREVIDRYWVPYLVVAAIVVARGVAELGLLSRDRTRRICVVGAALVLVVNVGLVAAFAATRSGDGIELNEIRYQDAELFGAVADADVDVVLTDSARLAEFHLVTSGVADVNVRDIGCRFSGESRVIELAEQTTGSTAVVLAGLCDREDTLDALRELPADVIVTDEPGVGTLVLIDRS